MSLGDKPAIQETYTDNKALNELLAKLEEKK